MPSIISIHAPARGATAGFKPISQAIAISIHAPARGATCSDCIDAHCVKFQSTPLREGRLKYVTLEDLLKNFNPRPCARGDGYTDAKEATNREFQSTPLREGRPSLAAMIVVDMGFNPRPCARGD